MQLRGEIDKLLKWRFKPPLFSPHPLIPQHGLQRIWLENAKILWLELMRPNYVLRGKIKLLKWSFKPPFSPPTIHLASLIPQHGLQRIMVGKMQRYFWSELMKPNLKLHVLIKSTFTNKKSTAQP